MAKRSLETGGFKRYIHSEKGRRHIGFASTTIASIGFGAYLTAQAFCLEKYKEIIQFYQKGFPVPVSSELLDLTEKVVEDYQLVEKSQRLLRVFYVVGFDPFFIGSLKTRFGGYIGLPHTFTYKRPLDIDKRNILVEQDEISWNSEDGQLFSQSLLLSENAKKFAIARSIAHLDTYHIYNHGGIITTALALQYYLGYFANNLLRGFERPKSFRYMCYSVVGAFTFSFWSIARDSYTRYHERYADEKACSLGISYAKGGVELYTKNIQRNIALRGLLGPGKGEGHFTLRGDQIEFIRQKHVPLTKRKEFTENVVKAYYNNSTEKLSNSENNQFS